MSYSTGLCEKIAGTQCGIALYRNEWGFYSGFTQDFHNFDRMSWLRSFVVFYRPLQCHDSFLSRIKDFMKTKSIKGSFKSDQGSCSQSWAQNVAQSREIRNRLQNLGQRTWQSCRTFRFHERRGIYRLLIHSRLYSSFSPTIPFNQRVSR